MEICSEIDGANDAYDAYRFNPKFMKISEIQRGLQLSLSDPSSHPVSLLCFLNEYYQRHIEVVYQGQVFPTTVKRLEPLYVSYDKGQYSVASDIDIPPLGDPVNIPLVQDIKKSRVYFVSHPKGPLRPISSYPTPVLHAIAELIHVELVSSAGKKKNKSELYEEIYVHLVNQ
tara:strand:- start:97 stop:612 length:516 start_codon:yes stop_codon:yes gene_type:complete